MKRSTDKFEAVEQKIVPDCCVVLDVATAIELPQFWANRSTGAAVGHGRADEQPRLHGLVHRRYAEADYVVISTNSQGLPSHCVLA
jgi:hypothetical protein